MKNRIQRLQMPVHIILACALLTVVSCNNDYTPKPRGYFRIALPQKQYRLLDSIYPYSFEIPTYARITNDPLSPSERNWINVELPNFHGRIHVSYKPIDQQNKLTTLTEDARTLALKHMAKSSGIGQIGINDPARHMYGLVYEIKGLGAASPYQFYLTDSTRNFLRGSLYFDAIPNNDSLAPVITFVKKDIQHLIETARWK